MRAARLLTYVWIVGTLILLGWPASGIPNVGISGLDKVAHFSIFLVGTVLALRGWPNNTRLAILLILIFAPLTEVWQAILPTGRDPSAWDVVANIVGIAAGWLIAQRLQRRSAERRWTSAG